MLKQFYLENKNPKKPLLQKNEADFFLVKFNFDQVSAALFQFGLKKRDLFFHYLYFPVIKFT